MLFLPQGKWVRPKKENPAYKGEWHPQQIPNPAYYEDLHPADFEPLGGVGFELWTMTDDILCKQCPPMPGIPY